MGLEHAHVIMQNLGFNKDSNEAVQVAFIKNLIRKTYGVEVTSPLRLQTSNAPEVKSEAPLAEQLSFDLDSPLKVS